MVKYEDSNAGTARVPASDKGVCEGQQRQGKQKIKGKTVAIWSPTSPSRSHNSSLEDEASSSSLGLHSERSSAMDAESSGGGGNLVQERRYRLDDELTDGKTSDGPVEEGAGQIGTRQWLQAGLEFHALGACRADERRRPTLRLNLARFGVQGRLLAHLVTNFKAKELALLARCLFAPLISIRVGKVIRQGRLLCPTCNRGYLILVMLPCSALRLSFIGDGGTQERIVTIRHDSFTPPVKLEVLLEDKSGRTFIIKLPNGRHLFFWQSEKSKSYGDEMLLKIRELMARRPTLAHLTGISPSRIQAFYDCLRSFVVSLFSSGVGNTSTSCAPLTMGSSESTVVQLTPSLAPLMNALLSSRSFLRASLKNKATLSNCLPRAKVERRSTEPVRNSTTLKGSVCKDNFLKVASTARSVSGSKEKHRRHRKNSSVHSNSASSSMSPPAFHSQTENSVKLNPESSITSTLTISNTTQALPQRSIQNKIKSCYPHEGLNGLQSIPLPYKGNHVSSALADMQKSVHSYGQRIVHSPLPSSIGIAIFKPFFHGRSNSLTFTSALLPKSSNLCATSIPLATHSYMVFVINNGHVLNGSGAKLIKTTSPKKFGESFAMTNVDIFEMGLCGSCKANGENVEAVVKEILERCLKISIPEKSNLTLLKIPVVLICSHLASGQVRDLYSSLLTRFNK